MEKKLKVKGYSWRPGSQHKVAAEVAATEMTRLLEEHEQRLDAADVVDAAASPMSPLHPEFEWDDSAAALQHRLLQARNLMNSVQVIFETPKNGSVVTSYMVSIQKQGNDVRKHDYTALAYAMSDEDLRAEVLQTALRELAAFKRKYMNLSELAQVISVINRTLKKTG